VQIVRILICNTGNAFNAHSVAAGSDRDCGFAIRFGRSLIAHRSAEVHPRRSGWHPAIGCAQPANVVDVGLLSVQGVSNVIGVIEIATAALIALRPFSRKASFVGSLAAVVTFLLTVSFLFSTPGAFHFMYGFPVLGDAGQFLIKDLVLLGASFWTAAEAFSASQGQGAQRCV
jgi:Protein of unknown function, DUF417